MEFTGDLKKDLDGLFAEFEKRGLKSLSVAAVLKIDDKYTFKRNFMSLVVPMVVASMQLAVNCKLSEETLHDKKFMDQIAALITVALMKEGIEFIHKKEIKSILKEVLNGQDS